MPEMTTKIHFSNRVQAHFDGSPVDLPAKRNDWLEFSFDGDISTLKESVYGGGERVVSVVTKGICTVRALATSSFVRDVVPRLIQKTQERGYFPITIKDENRDSKITIVTDFGGVVKEPVVKRGAPDLEEVEIQFDGFWYIIR